MSMNTSSLVLTKPSNFFNLRIIPDNSLNNQSFLGCSRSRFHYNPSSSRLSLRNRKLSVSCSSSPKPCEFPCHKEGIAGAVQAFFWNILVFWVLWKSLPKKETKSISK
ncbi:uncharacterized protein [Spinacia oleracea]|uniref:Uncharacterized protein n=1 Tax=Spinacia oleracea TaxID=3562 RepID=A0ABM3RE04_SPIOL|nr:uncharacterized protein LOC110802641 [Spinacia oleracea]